MGEFSLSHWLILAVILLLFFGPTRLPQLGESIGKAIRGFKKGMSEVDSQPANDPNARIESPKQQTMSDQTASHVSDLNKKS